MKRKFSTKIFFRELSLWISSVLLNLWPVAISCFKSFSTKSEYNGFDVLKEGIGSLDFQFIFIVELFVIYLQIAYTTNTNNEIHSFFRWSASVVVFSVLGLFTLLYSFDNVRTEIFGGVSVMYNLILATLVTLFEVTWITVASFVEASKKGVN